MIYIFLCWIGCTGHIQTWIGFTGGIQTQIGFTGHIQTCIGFTGHIQKLLVLLVTYFSATTGLIWLKFESKANRIKPECKNVLNEDDLQQKTTSNYDMGNISATTGRILLKSETEAIGIKLECTKEDNLKIKK